MKYLLKLMNYKHKKGGENEDFFIYKPKKTTVKKYKQKKQLISDNPFKILNNVNFK